MEHRSAASPHLTMAERVLPGRLAGSAGALEWLGLCSGERQRLLCLAFGGRRNAWGWPTVTGSVIIDGCRRLALSRQTGEPALFSRKNLDD